MISFETFYRNEYRAMLGMARALAPDTTVAEDLVQEAFITTHRRWDQVSQYDSPRAWVRRVLINRATSLRRRLASELRALARVGPADATPPDLSVETSEVWSEVHRLSRRQQQAIVLHYVGQLSMVEIADVMGCSQGAVKSHLHSARESLRTSPAAWDEELL
ncbi:MAG TPA: SigE family RNA polymerase sigma factor [Acidimicrobiia bacterium]